MLRQIFLFLSRRRALRRWLETSSLSQKLTGRFIAGSGVRDVLQVSKKLEGQGILTTLDHLGENVTTAEEAQASRDAILGALDEIRREGLRATVSIKLTQFGLDLGDGVCRANVDAVVERAKAVGSRVEIDMESSEYTSRTLAIVEEMHEKYGCVRAVLQAYLRRTESDIRRLNAANLPVRLCKGAYDESPEVAYVRKEEVDANYLRLANLLLDEGAFPALATHDEKMLRGVLDHAAERRLNAEKFEFQMLYGIRRDLQEMLVRKGYAVRVYVPYGDAWYPYFMRRLAERPANLLFVARNLLRA